MALYKNLSALNVRTLIHSHREVIDFALEVYKEVKRWPRYGAVASKYGISKHTAKKLIEIAGLSETDPSLFTQYMTLPRPPRKKPNRGISPARLRHKRGAFSFDVSHVEGEYAIYFLLAKEYPFVKIGYCKKRNLSQRLSMIQISSWAELTVAAIIPGGKKEEAELHRRFSQYRVRGEWFRYQDDLIEYIATLPKP